MDHTFCPGAKFLRQPKPENYPCPTCGEDIEIWSDEVRGYCSTCKKAVLKDSSTSCLDWCQYGKDCVGEEVYSNYMENKAVSLKKKLMEDLEHFFGDDTKRIDHARDVLEFAEEILKEETADWHVVVPAAILHDVGTKPAEEKYGSSEAKYQEAEGPPVAKKILFKHGLKQEHIDEICDIIGHHHTPRDEEKSNYRIVYDADCLVNMRRKVDGESKEAKEKLIDDTFLTPAGKRMARRLYLS